jgi:hypothetical protein
MVSILRHRVSEDTGSGICACNLTISFVKISYSGLFPCTTTFRAQNEFIGLDGSPCKSFQSAFAHQPPPQAETKAAICRNRFKQILV